MRTNLILIFLATTHLVFTNGHALAQTLLKPTNDFEITYMNPELEKLKKTFLDDRRSTWQKMNPLSNPYELKNSDEIKSFSQYLLQSKDWVSVKRDNSLFYYHKSQNKNEEPLLVVKMNTAEELRKFSPSSFKKMLAASRQTGKDMTATVAHTTYNFPAEAFIFYVAMGAVSAGHLVSDFGKNPVALQQNNESQLSLVGGFSFYAFMATQGASAVALNTFIKNPSWKFMIPYMSLGVGAIAQNYISSLLSDPNVKTCALSFTNQGKLIPENEIDQACDKAYEYLAIHKKIWDMAPSLTSMLAAQAVLAAGFNVAAKGAQELGFVRVAMAIKGMNPNPFAMIGRANVASIAVSGIWYVFTKVGHIAAFVELDHLISQTSTIWVKNIQENVPITENVRTLSDSLVDDILLQKKWKWNFVPLSENCKNHKAADCSGFVENLDSFSTRMHDFRTVSLTQVFETHAAWEQYLGQLVTMYNAAFSFYENLTSQIRTYQNILTDKQKSNIIQPQKFLSRKYPYNGITAEGTADKDDKYLLSPDIIEQNQVAALKKASLLLKNLSAEVKSKNYYLYPEDQNLLQDLVTNIVDRNYLDKNDRLLVGQGLLKLYNYLQTGRYSTERFLARRLLEVKKILGNSNPILEEGRGYLVNMLNAPVFAELLEKAKIPSSSDRHFVSLFKLQNTTDYLLMSMICGPNNAKQEPLIHATLGFPGHFFPPRINFTEDNTVNSLKFICDGMGVADPKYIYNYQIIAPYRLDPTKKQTQATYNGALDYLRNNIRPEVLGTANNNNFKAWWTVNTESQVTAAFEKFGALYEKNVIKLVKQLSTSDESYLNSHGLFKKGSVKNVSNNIIKSLYQELRVYLTILGEIVKDNATVDMQALVYPKEFLEEVRIYSEDQATPRIPLVKLMYNNKIYDFEKLASSISPANYKSSRPKELLGNLTIQNNIEAKFNDLNTLIREIKVVTDNNGIEHIDSHIDNSMLQDKVNAIEQEVTTFSHLLDVNLSQDDTKNTDAVVNLSNEAKQIAQNSLKKITALAYELMNYGMIANAVSWQNIQEVKKLSKASQEFNDQAARAAEQARNHNKAMPGR